MRLRRALKGTTYLRALAALVEQAPVGVCVLDRHGKYLVVNETLAAMNGLPVEDHIGRSVASVVPDIWARASAAIEHALSHPTPIVDMLIEGETARSPGELRSWLESWFPLPPDHDGEVHVAIVVREVTAERRMTQELKAADTRKDEFLATLAHELRNPLSPMMNCVPLLKSSADPAVVARVAGILERQLMMLSRLVEDLSDASRIRSGKFELRWENVDLMEILHDAIAAVSSDMLARGHTLNIELDELSVGVRGDGVRLSQLFGNVLRNACKFTPPSGTVWIGMKRSQRDVIVSVADNGVGIPPDRLQSVFERLSQADAPDDMRCQGLGIGLWLARQIAELHGGSIEAFSDGLGRGSRFDVTLPLRQRP